MPDPDRISPPAARIRERLLAALPVLVAALGVLAACVFLRVLAPLAGAIGAAVVLAAALAVEPPRREAKPAGPDAAPAPASAGDGVLSGIIEALPEAAAVIDASGILLAANAQAQALAPALRRGEPALLALRMPAVVEAIRQAAASGQPQRAEFAERVPVDRWYAVHVTPALLAPGPGRVLVLVFQDLTPLRRVEEMRADFVANASHELRTPLAALSGFIDTLLGPARNDAAAREKFLGIMQEQARRMGRLIDDLLSLSRIELNAHVRPQTPVEIVGVLRQVIDSLQVLARERGVEVVLSAPAELTVAGDRDELSRLFVNLVENALKYGGDGKRVEIAARATAAAAGRADEARISVRDFGAGIAPEHLPRLTERFYRIDVGHSRTEGGTGLGLALVKHILNRHGGTLSIESRPGEGATFTATLPVLGEKSR